MSEKEGSTCRLKTLFSNLRKTIPGSSGRWMRRSDSESQCGHWIVTPTANAPLAGRVAHRRFTDVWENIDGLAKLAIRQATYVQVQ